MGTNLPITEQFFEPVPCGTIEKEAYSQFDLTLPLLCEKMSRMCNKSIYVIDYIKRGFLWVSEHPLFLCGYSAQEVQEMGYNFYETVCSHEDVEMLLEINKFGWALFDSEKLPIWETKNACFSYDFFIHHKNGSRTLIEHKLSPLLLSPDNKMWLALCTVNLSSKKGSGNVVFTLGNVEEHYTYNFNTKTIEPYSTEKLSKREEEILSFIIRGYDDSQIAEELNISSLTAKTHRKNIMHKLKASNMINAATAYQSIF
ncbi:MAG: LuxR C-terminal-related transcriptional regulator [Bacteroidales bacterium]|jgi:DNA-binding CsgD family transcriptional regulator|nr:LuxR C-terminal-related transcriptional regulator [Bacteroidales bacterium]